MAEEGKARESLDVESTGRLCGLDQEWYSAACDASNPASKLHHVGPMSVIMLGNLRIDVMRK